MLSGTRVNAIGPRRLKATLSPEEMCKKAKVADIEFVTTEECH